MKKLQMLSRKLKNTNILYLRMRQDFQELSEEKRMLETRVHEKRDELRRVNTLLDCAVMRFDTAVKNITEVQGMIKQASLVESLTGWDNFQEKKTKKLSKKKTKARS